MIDLATARAYLGSDSTQDDLVLSLIDMVSATVARETGDYYGPPQDVREILDGTGDYSVWLDTAATTVTSVEVRGASRAFETVAAEDYEIMGRELTRFSEPWPIGIGNLRVGYTRGTGAPAPGEAQRAALELLGHFWQQKQASSEFLETDIDGMKEKRASGTPGDIKDILAPLPRRPAMCRNDSRVTLAA